MKSKKEKVRTIIPWVMLSILVLYGTYRDERVSEKLDGRKKWMDAVTEYMSATTEGRWTQREHIDFVHQLQLLNPDLVVPDVPMRAVITNRPPPVPE